MKKNKNRLALLLMGSSMGLLLALQVFWLTNSYEKAYFDMRRETNGLFRTTIFAMRDSLFTQSISPVLPESINHITMRREVDSLWKKLPEASSQVRVYINAQNIKEDTIGKILRPLAGRLRTAQFSNGKSFVIQITPDSLSVDSINHYFADVLQKNNLQVPFKVKTIRQLPPRIDFTHGRFRMNEAQWEDSVSGRIYSNKLQTDWVRFDPASRYSVILSDFRPLLLKQIAPQILFSVFLTLLTTVAFVVMYRSIRAQQKLMDLKNDFISNITHELKTPVTTVGVALEAIKNFKGQNNPELTTEYLDIAQNELNRLNILTDKILKTAIFEDKGVTYTAEPVDLHQVINQVLDSMKLVFEKNKAIVNFKTEGSDFNLMGGATHLTSVIYNLLDNALKYSPVNPEINISLQENKETITIRIRDNGIGIASEYKKKVFEKFFRVPTGDVHNIKGYGLGLSYVDSVVKSHNGTIEVESEPGKGSAFIIRLPKS
ncbi:MAG: HAMP domain-containing histidine kinase [Cyclobacteriaceae bacterium]|nr:HAMP domain-containing histidine kinase [Cyclobacteriaceae bacterium]